MEPEWLPPKVPLHGSMQEIYDRLHTIYQNEIVGEHIEIEGVPVLHNNRPDPDFPPYTKGFTHLVTRGDTFRAYDPERAARLSWVVPLLQNYKDPNVSCFWFETPQGAILNESLAIWLEEWDFILILRWATITRTEKIIVTAHHVDRGNKGYWQRKRMRPTSRLLQF